jgi:putative DNA primase/helicase
MITDHDNNEQSIRDAVSNAEEPALRPDLVVQNGNLPRTVLELRDIMAKALAEELFDRDGILVWLRRGADGNLHTEPVTKHNVVMLAHRVCRPVVWIAKKSKKPKGEEREKEEWVCAEVTLTERIAEMYVHNKDWKFRSLAGITSSPIMRADGSIINSTGYDKDTQMYVHNAPALNVPDRPTQEQAAAALLTLRQAFHTFPFADSELIRREDGLDYLDTTKAPQYDESSFLAGLLTAAIRASLWLCPGMLATAPSISGAGTGKGLLLRSVAYIALGIALEPFTAGHGSEEMDKRIASVAMSGKPVLWLSNLNSGMLGNDTLASVLTERPACLRIMGRSWMVTILTAMIVLLDGNGLRVTLDQARRLLNVHLDPRCENPESRPFKPGYLNSIKSQREELLSACFTILRWGRHNRDSLAHGKPLGSYEEWCEWVRNPLLTLGCQDPVEAMLQAKANDPKRLQITELFAIWWDCHKSDPVKSSELNTDVTDKIEEVIGKRSRQSVTDYLGKLHNTRIAGYLFVRHKPESKWGVTTYQLFQKDDVEVQSTPYGPQTETQRTPYGSPVADPPWGAHYDAKSCNDTTSTTKSIPTPSCTPYGSYGLDHLHAREAFTGTMSASGSKSQPRSESDECAMAGVQPHETHRGHRGYRTESKQTQTNQVGNKIRGTVAEVTQ